MEPRKGKATPVFVESFDAVAAQLGELRERMIDLHAEEVADLTHENKRLEIELERATDESRLLRQELERASKRLLSLDSGGGRQGQDLRSTLKPDFLRGALPGMTRTATSKSQTGEASASRDMNMVRPSGSSNKSKSFRERLSVQTKNLDAGVGDATRSNPISNNGGINDVVRSTSTSRHLTGSFDPIGAAAEQVPSMPCLGQPSWSDQQKGFARFDLPGKDGQSAELPGQPSWKRATSEGSPSRMLPPQRFVSGDLSVASVSSEDMGGQRFALHDVWLDNLRRASSLRMDDWDYLSPSQVVPHRGGDGAMWGPAQSEFSVFAPARFTPQGCCSSLPVMHPVSKKRVAWDVASIVLVLLDAILLPLQVFGLSGGALAFVLFTDWVSRIFWTLDILMSFTTGIYVNGMLVLRQHKIARNYSRTWLPFDLSLVVAEWVSGLSLDGTAERVVRAFRLCRILRLVKVPTTLHAIVSRSNSTMIAPVYRKLKFVFVLAVGVHINACLWYGVGVGWDDDSSGGWVRASRLEHASFGYRYLASSHWALSQLYGTSFLAPTNAVECVLANAALMLGLASFCVMLGSATCAMLEFEQQHRKQYQQQRALCMYLHRKRTSPQLSTIVKKALDSHSRSISEACVTDEALRAVLAALPTNLQADLAEDAMWPVIAGYSLLSDLDAENPRIVRQLCHEVFSEAEVCGPEILFTPGDACTRMIFVVSGAFGYTVLRRLKKRMSCDTEEGESPTPSPSDPRAGEDKLTELTRGKWACEAVLWTPWEYCGELVCNVAATILTLDSKRFGEVVSQHLQAACYAGRYARRFVERLNECTECSDVFDFGIDRNLVLSSTEEDYMMDSMAVNAECEMHFRGDTRRKTRAQTCGNLSPVMRTMRVNTQSHFIFVSHHKAGAGTEAVLMQEALERLIEMEPESPGRQMLAPVFLDSEDLVDLNDLQNHVKRSTNLLLLLTSEVLRRPWCLVEIVTAVQHNVNVILVEVQKRDQSFAYPDETFYRDLLSGVFLGDEATKLLNSVDIQLGDVEKAIRSIFMKIAIPFSPHKSANIREAELMDILRRCNPQPGMGMGMGMDGQSPTIDLN